MKFVLRKLKARIREKLDEAINFALDSVPIEHIQNRFKHCGYSVDL